MFINACFKIPEPTVQAPLVDIFVLVNLFDVHLLIFTGVKKWWAISVPALNGTFVFVSHVCPHRLVVHKKFFTKNTKRALLISIVLFGDMFPLLLNGDEKAVTQHRGTFDAFFSVTLIHVMAHQMVVSE
jgi:hypothetical protein